MIAAGETVPVMDGRKVFRLAVTRMPEATQEVLARCGHGIEDLDLLVMHQANLRINEAAQKALGLPDEKVYNNIQRYGNTTAASIPIALDEALAEGRLARGDTLVMTSFGSGFTWGSAVVKW
jgi:3-oxoacyl-[acyl-carrier-protein] synthase-3